jgi:hypothetical protein
MKWNTSRQVCAGAVEVILFAGALHSAAANAHSIGVVPGTMPSIATIDPRYQSYNVAMAEVVGGKFWKPYARLEVAGHTASVADRSNPPSTPLVIGLDPAIFEVRPPIDLSNARLRKMAAALGPAYIRVSGTWANSVFYQDSDAPAPATPPKGFQSVLTRSEWKGVVDFARTVKAKIVTSFGISAGVRDAFGVWTAESGREAYCLHEVDWRRDRRGGVLQRALLRRDGGRPAPL